MKIRLFNTRNNYTFERVNAESKPEYYYIPSGFQVFRNFGRVYIVSDEFGMIDLMDNLLTSGNELKVNVYGNTYNLKAA